MPASNGAINGKVFLLQVSGTTVAHSRDMTVTQTRNEIDASDKDDDDATDEDNDVRVFTHIPIVHGHAMMEQA